MSQKIASARIKKRENPSALAISALMLGLGASCGSSIAAAAGYVYLDDADKADSVKFVGSSDLDSRPFPRITTGPLKNSGTAEQFSKYGMIAVKASRFSWVQQVQAVNPTTKAMRIHCPQEYQGFDDKDACTTGNGIPFSGTGPATTGCTVYAGHWLYAPGSKLRSTIAATATTIQVDDASKFNAGRYVAIYDGSPGSFTNAEHARVTAVNTSTDTLTLANRGFKSTARSHPAGAVVAEHVIGNGDAQDGREWVWNLSTASPRDSSGRQINEVMAEWLANNYQKDGQGKVSGVDLEGILFDSDFHFIASAGHNKKPDVDNDLVLDNGISSTGENMWGDGLDEFYTLLRERLPNVLIVGGVTESRGYDALSGTQLEGWPQRNIGSAAPDYREIDGRLSTYSVQMHRGIYGPRYSEGINRVSTKLYPYPGATSTTNAPFRFSFGLALLDDGYYGQQNSNVTDPWWDEYAVDTVKGSATFGRAIARNSSNESNIRKSTGWMGFPLGPRSRVYDTAAFAAARSLMSSGTFDSDITGWTGNNVTVSRDTATANRLEGTGALHISKQKSYSDSETGASASGPTVQLTSGKQYTLAFGVKSSAIRTIQVAIGGETEQMYIPNAWTRQVVTFTASKTGSSKLTINVGRENSDVWVDSIYLFDGNADVFRRDFDKAVVVVNATPSSRTVDLGGTFRRIQGTGQDSVNNGATVTQVTIPSYDAAFLVRP